MEQFEVWSDPVLFAPSPGHARVLRALSHEDPMQSVGPACGASALCRRTTRGRAAASRRNVARLHQTAADLPRLWPDNPSRPHRVTVLCGPCDRSASADLERAGANGLLSRPLAGKGLALRRACQGAQHHVVLRGHCCPFQPSMTLPTCGRVVRGDRALRRRHVPGWSRGADRGKWPSPAKER